MSQELFESQLEIFNLVESDEIALKSDILLFENDADDIDLFFSSKSTTETESNNDHSILISEKIFTKKIQDHLGLLTKSIALENIDTQINEILTQNVFTFIKTCYELALQQITDTCETQQRLQTSLTDKFNEVTLEDASLFAQSAVDSSSDNPNDNKAQQLSYFAIHALSSILLILIKSAEKNDSTIIHQILTLTGQLCEQISMKQFSSSNTHKFLFKSIKPLINYINELSLSNDLSISKQAVRILLSFSVAKASFKDILPLLTKLIFDTVQVYNVRGLFIQLNNGLTEAIKQQKEENSDSNDETSEESTNRISLISVDYLKSLEVYPNSQLMEVDEKLFTGQFISSVILAHIDFATDIYLKNQFKFDSLESSFSFEFHPNTFKQLFDIIEQLSATIKQHESSITYHILNVCLRLFRVHLKFLCAIRSNLDRDLLTKNNEMTNALSHLYPDSMNNFDLTVFISDNELTKWFELLSKLACDENQKPERIIICKEASKALVCVINQRTSSFPEKLSLMHQYIIENQYPILIKEVFIELNKKEMALNWIEVLNDKSNRTTALKILYSFIDIHFNSLNEIDNEQIQNIILMFQHLLIHRLASRSDDSTTNELDRSTSASEYFTYVFKKSVDQKKIVDNLFKSILVGLCLMTKTNEISSFITIQPIFTAMLPLLAEHLLQNMMGEEEINNYQRFISWLLGKMCQVMLESSSLDSLEIKHTNKLKLALFAGGCEREIIEQSPYLSNLYNSPFAIYSQYLTSTQIQESSSDKEFLMSIYNNTGEGAQLISKMKMFVKTKQRLVQKSIEQQINDLSAVVFAVYIKHYRRINLAKYELSRTEQSKPHHALLSIYEYANYVQTLYATVKAQGGDTKKFYEQIKTNALFLLLSIKESDLIPIIEEDLPQVMVGTPQKKGFNFQRQISLWTKAKNVLRLLRNLMKACIRFKKLMLAKKRAAIQKYDYESILKQTIDAFLYENFSKTSTIDEVNQTELEEIKKCLCQQYERAMTRLITYRFAETFIQNICKLKDRNQVIMILSLFLPQLRSTTLEWSYLENISAVNSQLKEEIRNTYYRIIKMVLSYLLTSTTVHSKVLLKNIFYLLNLSYGSDDICHLYNHQFAVTLFTSFVGFVKNPESIVSLDLKLTAFYWFRLFVFKLSENIEMDALRGLSNQFLRRQCEIIFNTLVLNELRGLKQLKPSIPIETKDTRDDSLERITIGWFLQAMAKDVSSISNQFEFDLCINQYLVLFFRCVHYYEHVRSICSTVDYIEELLFIYHHAEDNITFLLTLKILRQLIPRLPESADGKSSILIEKFLVEILSSIGEDFILQQLAPEIITELIYIYRTMISVSSAWQMMAIQLIVDSIKSPFNFETNDQNQLNYLLASIGVLGGYIEPFCLGSTVKVFSDKQMTDEYQLAIVIEIKKQISNTEPPYHIQYLQTNQQKWVSVNQLELKIDVPPPNLLLLPNGNVFIHSILDALGSFIQIDTSISESIVVLQLKRRSISALYQMVNTQQLMEIFLQKSYASILVQLSNSNTLSKNRRQPADIRLFNKQHLEQYYLSLDIANRLNQINENENKNMLTENNQLIVDTLSISIWKYNGWKPYGTKAEVESFKKGQIGSNQISIVPMPSTAANMEALEECGNHHRFNGRILPTSQNTHVGLPTFIVDNLQVNEGKWYYCMRIMDAGVQLGWATNGFTPRGNGGVAIGDDGYSWSYDGARDILLNNGVYYNRFNTLWKRDDVCGCGIEIDGENTNIKYWLNGTFLGTAFKHQSNIGSSSTQCNLLPSGPNATYFPGVSLQFNWSAIYCELIFSPEDMEQCPLPDGYKPLLLPKLLHTENSIVAYPYSAYLVGDDLQDYFYQTRTATSIKRLRDFVNEHHLETDFTLEEQQLVLPKTSSGFPLLIDNDATSFTISFDFQLLPATDEQVDIQLITFDATDSLSLRIPSKKLKQKTRIVIILLRKEQQTQVYLDNDCQTFDTQFPTEAKAQLHLHLLPNIAAGITNIGVWKYALPVEQIHRLFAYGLFYVAVDYQQMKEHRKRANTFSFTNELLIPFDEPFEESIWENKKKQIDHNQLPIELFGNKSYLVLDKSNDLWLEYTLILDLSIPNWPINNEQLTIIALNQSCQLYINPEGQLCFDDKETSLSSSSKIPLNEYFRLWISIRDQSAKIFLNGSNEIEMSKDDHGLHATLNRFDLFREIDLTKNTTHESTLRIRCQSITFINRFITIDDHVSQPNSSLETIIAPSLSLIISNLIAIGYKKEWILSVIEQYKATHIQTIDTIIRENKEQFLQKDQENKQNNWLKILSRLSPTIDQNKLKDVINTSKNDIVDLSELILTRWNDLQTTKSEKNLDQTEWMPNKSISMSEVDASCKLFDLTQLIQQQQQTHKSTEYSHQNISPNQYSKSRIACEHGLTTIYARYIILNILKICSNNTTNVFPLEQFGGCTFLVRLLRLMEHNSDEDNDQMSLLINSILKTEMTQSKINGEILQNKTPFLFQLQQDIVSQIIYILLEPSQLEDYSDNDVLAVDEQEIIKRPSLNFIFKVLNLFVELLKDQTESFVSLLFPVSIVNLMFDLFLVVPTDQSNFFLLQLFSKLMQKSKEFHLTESMEQFLTKLLVENSSNNRLSKNVEMIIIELLSLSFMKQNDHRQSVVSDTTNVKDEEVKLPENVRDIFLAINVIDTLTNQMKPTVLLEPFFARSENYLSTELKLSQEEFEQANLYFDPNSDQQLINLMNNDPSLNYSFTDFIRSLPTESVVDPIFYKNYLSLSNIPADCIQIRARFIYQLNQFLKNLLPFIDFNLLSGESYLSDKTRTVKIYLLYSTKFELFNETLGKTASGYANDSLTITFDTVNENNEQTMFHQAYQQLRADAHTIFRGQNDRIWRAEYLGMHSADAGGPYRDSITRICSDICSSRLSLFILCPNGRTNSGLNRDCWTPNVYPPNKPIPNKSKKQYRFIGQLMGMAIRKKHYLDLKFPLLLWKQLLREEITIEDVQAIDAQSFTLIDDMEKNIEQTKVIDDNTDINSLFSNIMSELRFDVVSSAGQTYELIPGGMDIPITAANFKKYCTSYRYYRLNEFQRQIEFIRQGLHSVVPCYYLNLFTAEELEEAVCGKGEIDVELLKKNTSYGGYYDQDSPVIQRFWTVFGDMFSDEQRKLFLTFVWGRKTLPYRDEDFQQKFNITEYYLDDDQVDKALPRSHTCYFTIDLPKYSTAEIMYERLNYAITYCSSIDGDGNFNETRDTTVNNIDSSSDEL